MSATRETLYSTIEVTWPCARHAQIGPFTIRDGAGGGKRASAATARIEGWAEDPAPDLERHLPAAESAMARLGQPALFMIRQGDEALDALLAARRYRLVDPVNIYLASIAPLAEAELPHARTFTIWEPLAIMRDIWAANGVGPRRVAVMERATCLKTGLFGRYESRPAGAGYVGVAGDCAMVHALVVIARARRCGMGRRMMLQAARWAGGAGADQIAALCTAANPAGNALYASLGFALVGRYHYRIKGDDNA